MCAQTASSIRIRRIGGYLLGRRIGAGGMAAVFAARQQGPLDLGRLVAVKVMSTALVGDPSYERLFRREAGITARLEHRNVVRVYEVGEADGTLFIAMEFVHGASLRDLIGVGPPPLAIVLKVLEDVCGALHAAHELREASGDPLSLVHQDVSPHNIMITYSGVTKLLDFGVARIGAMDASRTETIRGKPSYLAPEQISGSRIDRRTDVFALGIVMFELLTGERLFSRPSALQAYKAITEDPIPTPTELVADLPEAIAEVCQRALSRDPDERFQTARAFGQAIATARTAAGLDQPSDEQLGEWATSSYPPGFSLGQLEREIIHGSSRAGGSADTDMDVADMPTQVPTLADDPDESPSQERTRADTPASRSDEQSIPLRRPWQLFVVGALMLLLGGSGAYLLRGETTTLQPKPSASPSAPPPASNMTATAASASKPLASVSTSLSGSHEPAPGPSQRWPLPTLSTNATAPPGSTSTTPTPTTTASTESVTKPLAMGRLAIRSTPWGAVLVDGTNAGNSPKVVSVKPGPHTVTVRTKDGQQQSRSVTVRPGELTSVRFVF